MAHDQARQQAGALTLERGDLLDQVEAATLLGIRNPRTLAAWRLRRQGPPFVKLGTNVRYLRRDLEAYIAASRVVPAAASP